SFPHYHHTYLQSSFFFFNDPATTGIYTLSLHDALPICARSRCRGRAMAQAWFHALAARHPFAADGDRQLHHHVGRGLSGTARCRSEEHTSELQSLAYLVCRLLLEKKKKYIELYETQMTT